MHTLSENFVAPAFFLLLEPFGGHRPRFSEPLVAMPLTRMMIVNLQCNVDQPHATQHCHIIQSHLPGGANSQEQAAYHQDVSKHL